MVFDLILGQRLEPGAESDLPREGQTGETDQLLVLDEDAVQRDPPARRQARRRVDRGAGFRCRVERNDDAFDLLCHRAGLGDGGIARQLGGFGGEGVEPRGDALVERARRVIAVVIGLARRKPGQQRQTLIDGLDREDAEALLGRRGDDILTQHQVLDVARRDDRRPAAR